MECLHRSLSPFPDYVLSEHNEKLGESRDEVNIKNNYSSILAFVVKVTTNPIVCLRMGIPASPARTPTFTQK